ncbi:hypothetical protein [Marinicauda pacifica]|uniref:hypothetical protein n=1 Tax=Marinicauda pacifica TaxID=1133559 RepID=UPI0035C839EE
MTEDTRTQAQADLAFVRAMTERASRAPLLGGRFLLLWGGLLTLTYLAHFTILSELAGVPVWAISIIWPAFGVLGFAGTVILSRGMGRKPGVSSIGNVVEREIWKGAGLGIFIFVAGVVVAVTALGRNIILFDLIAAVALALYGAAFLATSAASGLTWMRIPAWASFAFAACVPLLAGTAVLYLALSAVILLVAVLPGLRLLLNEPEYLEQEDAS